MPGVHVRLLLEHSRVAAGRDRRMHGLVRLVAERRAEMNRPPVDLVACIDVSGSMEGRKLAEARFSVSRLVRELESQDRLGLVAFSSEARRLSALVAMDHAGRTSAENAVARLRSHSNTNMSGGLLESLETLAEPQRPACGKPTVRRVLLFTDGHANEGIAERDRSGWASLVREQLGDASVSWFGYGEDHDADFLAWLADQTRGNSYVARDADAIADAFAKELGGLLGTVARDVRVKLRTGDGEPVLLNDERAQGTRHGLRVDLADLSSEEQRDLVFELPVAAGALGSSRRVVEAEVSWIDARTGRADSVVVSAEVEFVDEARTDDASRDVLEAFALQHAAAAMRLAAQLADAGDFARAEARLMEAALLVRDVETDRAREIVRILRELAHQYGESEAYGSSKARLASVRRSMGKQRSSGSEIDAMFLTNAQKDMLDKFGKGPHDLPSPPHPGSVGGDGRPPRRK